MEVLVRSVLLAALSLAAVGCRSDPAADEARVLHDDTVKSSDGVPIHFVVGGRGDTALVFVHGWTGNASWWRPVMERFAPDYRVVALDLAGHGASGRLRKDWSVERFAGDVAAVVRALDLQRVVLLGHSMSGTITVEAARVIGRRVVLLVPVDTLQDAEWDLPDETWKQFFAGLRADFPRAVEGFFRGMLAAPGSPPEVIDRVVADARRADPKLAVPMLERARAFDLRTALRDVRVPIHALNSDRTPTRLDRNCRYARRFEVDLLPGVGHWPMLEEPEAFGDALERVLDAYDVRGD